MRGGDSIGSFTFKVCHIFPINSFGTESVVKGDGAVDNVIVADSVDETGGTGPTMTRFTPTWSL